MNKPNTPKKKPAKAPKQNNNTAKVSRYISRWNPARDYVDPAAIESSKAQAGRLFTVLSKGHRIHRLKIGRAHV